VTSRTAATTNTLTGVSGVRIGQKLGMCDGGDRGTTVTMMTTSRRADRIGEATFRRHPVRVRGLLVRCG